MEFVVLTALISFSSFGAFFNEEEKNIRDDTLYLKAIDKYQTYMTYGKIVFEISFQYTFVLEVSQLSLRKVVL